MAPTPAQATSGRIPQEGTLAPSSAQFHIGGGTGAIKGVIIVFAILGTLAVIAIPVFILRRRSKSPSLPPVQTLAHYRERESKFLPQPYLPHKELDERGESGGEEGSLGPVRMSSVRTTDSSQSRPTHGSASSSSTHLATFVNASCPLSVNSQSDEQAPSSKGYVSTAKLARSSSLSRSRSWSRHELSREPSMSMVDLTRNASTRTSSRSVSAIRGAPHHPHNTVEIVLPAPLAPHLRDDTSAIQVYGHLPESGGLISDQWMVTHLVPAPWCPSADHELFEEDSSPKRHTYPRFGYQNQSSLDAADQLERSGVHPRPRGRSSSRCTSQPQPLGPETPTVSPQSSDGQIRPLRPTSQDSCDGQAMNPPFEHRGRPRPKLRSRSNPRSRPRRSFPSCDAPNCPCPQSALHSWRGLCPSREAESPPPVPPLPQLPQSVLHKQETRHLANIIRASLHARKS